MTQTDGNRKCAKCGHAYDDHEIFNGLACTTYDLTEEPCSCDGFEDEDRSVKEELPCLT